MDNNNKHWIIGGIIIAVIIVLISGALIVSADNDEETSEINNCIIAGCNGELCVNKDMDITSSICMYKEEYTCLEHSVCEMQVDDKCGWTRLEEYNECLDEVNSDIPTL